MKRIRRAIIRYKIHLENRWRLNHLDPDTYRSMINIFTDREVERQTTEPVRAYCEITGDSFFANGIPFKEGLLKWSSVEEAPNPVNPIAGVHLEGSRCLLEAEFKTIHLNYANELKSPHMGRKFLTSVRLYSRALDRAEVDSFHDELASKLVKCLGDPASSKYHEAFYNTPAHTSRLWDMQSYYVIHSLWHDKGDQPHGYLEFQRCYHPDSGLRHAVFEEWTRHGGGAGANHG